MKRIPIVVLTLLLCSDALGGSYYGGGPTLGEYDRETGYYLVGVRVAEERGFLKGKTRKLIDVYVYFPKEDKGAYLFDRKNKDEIVSVLYETYYDESSKAVVFNTGGAVRNNVGVPKRAPKNKVLICTFNEQAKTCSLWVCSKRGEHLEKLRELPKGAAWHIDALNSRIRIVAQKEGRITIENLDW